MRKYDFVKNIDEDKSEFERSLDDLCSYDVAPVTEEKGRGGAIAFNIFRYGLLLAFVGIFVYCVLMIGEKSVDYARADDIYSDLAERFESDDFALGAGSEILHMGQGSGESALPDFSDRLEGKLPEEAPSSSGGAMARAKIAALKELNPDAVAWIMVDGTRISLPIVQGKDNKYYLDVAFDGSENWAGTVFLDCDSSPNVMENYNYVTFGHNMEGGQMYSDITRFLDEEFFWANRYITLYTEQGLYTYEIFAAFKTKRDTNYYHTYFESKRDFCDFMYDMKYTSMYTVDDMEFTEDDRIITLSTCTNENGLERYALQGKLIKVEE